MQVRGRDEVHHLRLRRPDRGGPDDSRSGAHNGAVADRARDQQPLHQQITLHFTRQIESGDLPPGSMLLPETELARRFGVSRQTVRTGLDALVRSGLIDRRRGRGTVVRRPTIEQSLSRFYSVAHAMQDRGAILTTQVLARGRLSEGDELAAEALNHLHLADPTEIGYLLRLRLVDATPLLLETLTFPASLCLQLLEPAPTPTPTPTPTSVRDGGDTRRAAGTVGAGARADNLGAGSFYDALAERSGIHVSHARENFRPIAVAGYEARLLQIAPGTPVFEVERVSFAAAQVPGNADEGRPVEWRRTIARGDRYGYVAELVNPSEHEHR